MLVGSSSSVSDGSHDVVPVGDGDDVCLVARWVGVAVLVCFKGTLGVAGFETVMDAVRGAARVLLRVSKCVTDAVRVGGILLESVMETFEVQVAVAEGVRGGTNERVIVPLSDEEPEKDCDAVN